MGSPAMCNSAAGSICCTIWCFYGCVTCMLFGSFGFWNSDYYLVENFGTGFGFTHNKSLGGKVVYNSDASKCSFPYDTEDCLKMKIGASFVASGLLYFGFSIFSLICASRHINKAKQDKYQALNSDEMAELNTPYLGGESSYGSTGDQSPDMEQKKDTLETSRDPQTCLFSVLARLNTCRTVCLLMRILFEYIYFSHRRQCDLLIVYMYIRGNTIKKIYYDGYVPQLCSCKISYFVQIFVCILIIT